MRSCRCAVALGLRVVVGCRAWSVAARHTFDDLSEHAESRVVGGGLPPPPHSYRFGLRQEALSGGMNWR